MTTHQQRALFGASVKRERDARGWSQRALGERLGIPDSTVASWEQGGGATEDNVKALEQLFGLESGALGWRLGQAPPPATHSPEHAIGTDPTIPEDRKRILLATLAEIRKLNAEPD